MSSLPRGWSAARKRLQLTHIKAPTKTITHRIDIHHITNGCDFTSFENAELTFDSELLCELRKGIEAAKVLTAQGVDAEIRFRNAAPDTHTADFDDCYSYDFEYAILDDSNCMVFW
jgi:hypothetical protein